ncbi:MAG: hypothetical protein R3E39_28880 [Anaerolineae bacterium]
MKPLTIAIALSLVLMIGVKALAQPDILPPLGYATVNEWYTQYHVYDFSTQSVQTITYPERPDAVYYGSADDAETIMLKSPYDESVRFELVRKPEVGDADQHSHTYDLYRLKADGMQELVLENVNSYVTVDYWSPNGRFLYVVSDIQSNGGGVLAQYELETGEVNPLQDRMWGIAACQRQTVWCILRQISPGEGKQQPITLYLFNRNDGSLQELGTSTLIFTATRWLGDGSDFLYTLATDDEHYNIHHHDAQTGSDDLLGTVSTQYDVGLSWSPDERWLLVQTRGEEFDKTRSYVLQVFDLQKTRQEPLLVTDDYRASLSQSGADSQRWLDNNTLLFASGGREITLNTITLPEGNVREVVRFDRDVYFFDHDWSPDGKWIALSSDKYSTTSHTLYLMEVSTGTVQTFQLPVSDDSEVCIGWFSQAKYESGQANLCDMSLGEG